MSSPRSLPPASPAVRGLPRGEVVGRYGTYADAQKAVDRLADEHFEVDRIAIVGNDLKSVEQVTGRLSYPKVAGRGALNGVVFGAFLGMIMSLLGGEQWMSSLLVSMLLGGAFWMLLATVGYAMQRGRRDFTSTNQIVATSYDVVAAPEVAQRARQVLQGSREGRTLPPAQDPARPAPGEQWRPPAYGAPPAGGPAQGGAAAGTPPADGRQDPAPERSALFEDLPDGRPQYGIRLPEGGTGTPEDPSTREDRDEPPGSTSADASR